MNNTKKCFLNVILASLLMTTSTVNATAAQCLTGVTSSGEKISSAKCIGVINQINKMMNQPLPFPNGTGEFLLNVDKSCGYLSEVPSKDQEMVGQTSASIKALAGNMAELKSLGEICIQLLDHHLPKN